jgi:hypothetical protein
MENEFERLLDAMPSIADAVNAFSSETAQQVALQALLANFRDPDGAGAASRNGQRDRDEDVATDNGETNKNGVASGVADGKGGTGKRPPKSGGRRGVDTGSLDKSLNLSPPGIESFADFSKRCAPTSQNEKVLISTYWLRNIAEVEIVGHDQIYTCFRHEGWTLPSNMSNKVSQTGSMLWLSESKKEMITLGTKGINHVEQVMMKRGSSSEEK